MGTINCLGISIKIKKILACLFWAIFGVCLLTIPTFAAENIGGEPVDRSGTVTYISKAKRHKNGMRGLFVRGSSENLYLSQSILAKG